MSAWTVAVAALSTQPSLWWRLGEASGTTLADASGNSHAGTLSGSTISYGVTGPLVGDSDKAMSFTGTNPVGQIAYAAWQEGTQFSVVCWFKVASSAAVRALHGRDSQSGGRRYQLQLDITGKLVFTTVGTSGAGTATSTSAYDDNAWHMVTITYDQTLAGAARQNIYVDGSSTPVATGGQSNSLGSTGTAVPFSVGNLTRTTQTPTLGTLDEVMFWPGTVLTGSDHLALYNAGTGVGGPGAVPMPNPVTRLRGLLAR